MPATIKKGDTVELISGAHKGTTGKVEKVLKAQNAVLIEGLGIRHRHIKPSTLNPRGLHKDIHTPVSLHKVKLVTTKAAKPAAKKTTKETK